MNINEVNTWNSSYEKNIIREQEKQNKEMLETREYINKVKDYLDAFFISHNRKTNCSLPQILQTNKVNRKGYKNIWSFKDYVEYFYYSQYKKFVEDNIHNINLQL